MNAQESQSDGLAIGTGGAPLGHAGVCDTRKHESLTPAVNGLRAATGVSKRPKVIFFAEDVTLAHFGRMVSLARALDASRFEVVFACGPQFRHFLRANDGFRVIDLTSTSSAEFNRRLERNAPLYPLETLQQYVAQDLAIFAREAPEVVVGDFRLSLGISAELAKVPSISIGNGCWSPFSTLPFPVPEHPVLKRLSEPVAKLLMKYLGPFFMKAHFAPYNQLRRSLGLEPVDSLRAFYTQADVTLYTDSPTLSPTKNLPPSHHYLGPVLWEPDGDVPSWWNQLPDDKPVVYLSSGSSGDTRLGPIVLEALSTMPVSIIAASGTTQLAEVPRNAHVSSYLPGIAAARRARIVISNGGSGTLYQALSGGAPLLGIPSNADQHLCMAPVVATGAGRVIRSGQLTVEAVRREVATLLEPKYKQAAELHRAELSGFDAAADFTRFVDDLLLSRTSLASS